jgi:hypothetical protein
MENTYRVFVSDKWPVASHRQGCEGNIKVDLVERGCEDVDWIELNSARVKWVSFCDHVLNFVKAEILLIYEFILRKYISINNFSIKKTLAVPIPRIKTKQQVSAVTRPKSHKQSRTFHTRTLCDIKVLSLKHSVQKVILIPCSDKGGGGNRQD